MGRGAEPQERPSHTRVAAEGEEVLKKWNLQRRRIDCSVLPRGAPQACMRTQWGWHQSWIVFLPYHKPSTLRMNSARGPSALTPLNTSAAATPTKCGRHGARVGRARFPTTVMHFGAAEVRGARSASRACSGRGMSRGIWKCADAGVQVVSNA